MTYEGYEDPLMRFPWNLDQYCRTFQSYESWVKYLGEPEIRQELNQVERVRRELF